MRIHFLVPICAWGKAGTELGMQAVGFQSVGLSTGLAEVGLDVAGPVGWSAGRVDVIAIGPLGEEAATRQLEVRPLEAIMGGPLECGLLEDSWSSARGAPFAGLTRLLEEIMAGPREV